MIYNSSLKELGRFYSKIFIFIRSYFDNASIMIRLISDFYKYKSEYFFEISIINK